MTGVAAPGEQPAVKPSRRGSRSIILLCALLGGVLLGVPLLLRTFVITAFKIPSGAMVPTLLIGDYMFTSKWSQEVRRGDVVVFRYPPDPTVDYVKRVIGVAGDKILITNDGVVLNGQPLPRHPVSDVCPEGIEEGSPCEQAEETVDGRAFTVVKTRWSPYAFGPVVVPEGHVFVLGDNRDNSSDSRVWGPVPLGNVKAHALSIWWSRGTSGVRWKRIGRGVR